ncbi:hypothetical protein GE191_13535 [Serratia fonticola]|uniref:hypothetical protein n=1 Tax=Serratia fonticola TaxID=47917 RepID=UPI001378066D|nr:hypothetical protein [Serratia fonticola]NBJ34703.1 hypothetical protein [Serratia fonticola]
MKNKLTLVCTLALLAFASSSSAEKKLSEQEALADCNKSASVLVESYEKDAKVKELNRLALLSTISETCQNSYQAASAGIQYKDIEADFISNARKVVLGLEDQRPELNERRVGLMVAAMKAGYYIFDNGGLPTE